MSDDLGKLLKTWRHQAGPAPEFKSAVWARIESAEGGADNSRVLLFPRALPLAAGLAVVLSVAAGVGAGLARNRQQTSDRMASAYARTIDPVLMSGFEGGHQP